MSSSYEPTKLDPSPLSFRYRKRGYRRLAEYMAWDSSMAVFPRFQSANALNLLCLQAEVLELEEQLNDIIDQDDCSNDKTRQTFSTNMEALRQLGADSNQRKKYLELRAKLAEYNQALAHQIIINEQASPEPYDYKLLQDWIVHPRGGDGQFSGLGYEPWLGVDEGGHQRQDHIALSPKNSRTDVVTRLMSRWLTPVLRRLPVWIIQKRYFLPEEGEQPDLCSFSSSTTLRAASDRLTSLAATILILIPVVVLHFLTNTDLRLAVIVIFSLGFTTLILLTTDAKPSEIFAASAAFVAVQVVYVGSTLGSTSGGS